VASSGGRQLCANAATLHGTFVLDVEGCGESGDNTGDLWWEQIDSVQRQLVPWSSGDEVTVLGTVDGAQRFRPPSTPTWPG
jgi:hypothetical protein